MEEEESGRLLRTAGDAGKILEGEDDSVRDDVPKRSINEIRTKSDITVRHDEGEISMGCMKFVSAVVFFPSLVMAYIRRLTAEFGWRYVAFVVIVYGVNQGIGEGWAFFAAQYLLTDSDSDCQESGHCGLNLDADRYAEVDGFTNVPWQIKSIYGILSDTLPIGTLHRSPYILIASISGIISYPAIALVATASVPLVAIFLLAINYSMASPDVIIDASVAERCRDHPKFASDLQTLCWGSFGLGKIISSATSGPLYERIGSRGLFGLTTLTSLAMMPPSLAVWRPISGRRSHSDLALRGEATTVSWLPEKPEQTPRACNDVSPLIDAYREESRGILIRLSLIVCASSILMGMISMGFDDDTVTLIAGICIGTVVCTAVYYYERKISPPLAKASVYIFLQGAIQPSTNVMYLWFKDSDENCSADAEALYGKRPCFSATFYSQMITVSYVFFVLGTAMYNRYFSQFSYRKIWTSTQILLVAVNLLDLVWVLRWNVSVGVPDEVFFFGEELIAPLISRLNTMPLFILAAKLCPPKMEGTLFATQMGLSNFGVVMGQYMGNGLLMALGGVEGPAFERLDSLVIIRSFARLLPILLIPFLVPDGSPDDPVTTTTDIKDSEAMDTDNEDDPSSPVLGCRRKRTADGHVELPSLSK